MATEEVYKLRKTKRVFDCRTAAHRLGRIFLNFNNSPRVAYLANTCIWYNQHVPYDGIGSQWTQGGWRPNDYILRLGKVFSLIK